MMKYFTFVFLFLFSCSLYGQLAVNVRWQTTSSSSDTIVFNKNLKLTWQDFNGIPIENGIAVATTFSGFGYLSSMKTINGKGNLNITLFCFFDKSKSWVKPTSKNDYTLNHEQHHFDVSYIAACSFANKLKKTHFTSQNFKSLLTQFYNKSISEMEDLQHKYDEQTHNGILKKEQEKWNKKIEGLVAKYIE